MIWTRKRENEKALKLKSQKVERSDLTSWKACLTGKKLRSQRLIYFKKIKAAYEKLKPWQFFNHFNFLTYFDTADENVKMQSLKHILIYFSMYLKRKIRHDKKSSWRCPGRGSWLVKNLWTKHVQSGNQSQIFAAIRFTYMATFWLSASQPRLIHIKCVCTSYKYAVNFGGPKRYQIDCSFTF